MRHEASSQTQGHRHAHDEAAGLGAHHLGDAGIGEVRGQIVHHGGEGRTVRESRREVLEHDTRLRIVGNGHDELFVGAHEASFLIRNRNFPIVAHEPHPEHRATKL